MTNSVAQFSGWRPESPLRRAPNSRNLSPILPSGSHSESRKAHVAPFTCAMRSLPAQDHILVHRQETRCAIVHATSFQLGFGCACCCHLHERFDQVFELGALRLDFLPCAVFVRPTRYLKHRWSSAHAPIVGVYVSSPGGFPFFPVDFPLELATAARLRPWVRTARNDRSKCVGFASM